MLTRLDIQRLAVRIENLQRVSVQTWSPGDDLEFRNLLPGSRAPRALPDPRDLRDGMDPTMIQWQNWLVWARRAEDLVHANRPGNMARVMRDMARGRAPGLY